MNKKGFTLIELIVSITLVSIILVSLLATLVKLKQTYEVIEEDSDIRIYKVSFMITKPFLLLTNAYLLERRKTWKT